MKTSQLHPTIHVTLQVWRRRIRIQLFRNVSNVGKFCRDIRRHILRLALFNNEPKITWAFNLQDQLLPIHRVVNLLETQRRRWTDCSGATLTRHHGRFKYCLGYGHSERTDLLDFWP